MTTSFTENQEILGNMRTCLVIMAGRKGIELERKAEDYGMLEMLSIMKEMESRSDKLSIRLNQLWDDIIIFGCTAILFVLRNFLKLFGVEVPK